MAMLEIADSVLGLSLKSEQLGYGHMAARALLMYLLLIVIVRSAKKRFFKQRDGFRFHSNSYDRCCGGPSNDRWRAVFSSDARRRCTRQGGGICAAQYLTGVNARLLISIRD